MRIVVNADDFGASADTVAATVAALERGTVTSATILLGMPATEEALAYAAAAGGGDFGLHLNLVGDEGARPLARAEAVPALVDARGALLPTAVVRRRALTGKLPREELAREIRAQLHAVLDRGIRISHVDSHRHVHKLGPVREALGTVLGELGIDRVRTAQDVWLDRPVLRPTYMLGPLWKRRLTARFHTTDHFFMPSGERERSDWPEKVVERMGQLPGRTIEVGVHPGRADPWRASELEAVQRFTRLALEQGHALTGWDTI